MITTKRCILIAEKCEFLERFEATEFADISEIQNVWKRNKTPIISDKLVANKLAGYNVLNVPEEIIGNVEEFTNFCHENGFECGEFISGITYDTAQERCFMCELTRHRGMGDLVRYNQYVEKTVDCIIYETENFYVTSELGALKLGYLMIVPKEHILSVAQFPERLFDEYQEVKEDTEKMLKVAFDGSSVTFWEHGSGPSGKTSHKKSIVHAHTHVVVDFELKEKYQDMVQLRPCFDITEAKYVHYFSYQEGSKGQLMISMDPSVYMMSWGLLPTSITGVKLSLRKTLMQHCFICSVRLRNVLMTESRKGLVDSWRDSPIETFRMMSKSQQTAIFNRIAVCIYIKKYCKIRKNIL